MQAEKDITPTIIDSIRDKKGSKIAIIDLAALGASNASKFIICEGKNTTQVGAIADSIRDNLLEKANIKPINYDGYRNSQWIVLDYGDIFVHVFLPEFREFYNLEELWSDAPIDWVADLD